MRSDDGTELAAGGLVVRPGGSGPEVLLVHRPRYDDWSLPKGKLRRGESAAAAALREVEEETGVRAVLGPELAAVTYTSPKGRPKQVRWFAMTVGEVGRWTPTAEVDVVRWVPATEVASLLTYAADRDLVERFTPTTRTAPDFRPTT